MSEQKRKPCKLVWFKFYPTDFFSIISMSDADAGKRFKKFIECLAANKAPKDSIEDSMINEAKAYSEWKRQIAYKRWNKEPAKRENKGSQRKEFEPPPSPAMEKMNKR